MLTTVTDDVGALKTEARLARKSGDLDSAERHLREAIRLLEPEVSKHPKGEYGGGQFAPEDVRDNAKQLADCYGSLAGILRRRNKHGEALDLYRKGKELEERDEFSIGSTYNRIQWIVTLLETAGSETPETQAAIKDARSALALSLPKNPWDYADRALIAALDGDRFATDQLLYALESSRPIKDVYTSGLPVVQRLHQILPGNAALAQAESWYAAKAQ